MKKAIETWNLTIPLYDNNGNPFKKETIESILKEISLNFPGFTIVNIIGYWKNLNKIYIDKNLQLKIDTFPFSQGESSKFFEKIKKNLKERLGQEKIYVTKETTKQEFISFDEFFEEIGIEYSNSNDINKKRKLAKELISKQEFILQRLGYETILLKRKKDTKKIIWERKICGIIIKSEFEDVFPPKIKIFPADQIDLLGSALSKLKSFALVGHYEFQNYVLDKINYNPLIEVESKKFMFNKEYSFRSPSGKNIPPRLFIEYFATSIITNYIALRDEGYLEEEIHINVGHDGSMQIGQNEDGRILLFSPAMIPDDDIIEEVIYYAEILKTKYENNELNPIALLQSKARNRHLFKRAFIRNKLRKDNYFS